LIKILSIIIIFISIIIFFNLDHNNAVVFQPIFDYSSFSLSFIFFSPLVILCFLLIL
jgi:hypothetical protein